MYSSNNNTAWLRWSYVQASKMPSWKGLVCRSFKFHRKRHIVCRVLWCRNMRQTIGGLHLRDLGSWKACEKMACVVTGKTLCSGQGQCLTISQWAPHSRDENGNLRGITYTETDTTWDANRIYGCMCDRNIYKGPKSGNVVDAFGYACSRHICPHGDILTR